MFGDELHHCVAEVYIACFPSSIVHDLEALDAAQENRGLSRLITFDQQLKHIVEIADVTLS